MKILIADDEQKIVEQLKKYLEKKDHLVDAVTDGDQALELIKPDRYDIVFLDDNMPGATGLELVEYIKNNNLKAKAVILTGYPLINESFCKMLKTDEYLEKPIDLKKIEDIINKYRV